jgi:glycosyltransferase involved in cell wall biosynthesis
VTSPDATAGSTAITSLLGEAVEPCFWRPERAVGPDGWIGHIPFAFWLVATLRPGILVDLGGQAANAYAAFCQAVDRRDLPTRCFRIGDANHGPGGASDFAVWHDARYGGFSRLIPAVGKAAVEQLGRGSIDLLHIDGCNGGEDGGDDLAVWRSYLSPRAVLLLHGTSRRGGPPGALRLWQHLMTRHPSFELPHGDGLGVLGIGADLPAPLGALFATAGHPAAQASIRAFFAHRGDSVMRDLRADTVTDGTREPPPDRRHPPGSAAMTTHTVDIERHRLSEALRRTERATTDAANAIRAQRDAEARLAAVLGSTTWRATAPLRRVLEAAPRLRRGLRSASRLARSSTASPPVGMSVPQPAAGRAAVRRDVDQPTRPIAPAGAPVRLDVRDLGPAARSAPPGHAGRPSIICLSHVAPWPPRAGNEYRIHRLLAWLQGRGWDVVLLFCPLPGEEPDEAKLADLAAAYLNLVVVHRGGELRCSLARVDARAAIASLHGRRTRALADALGEAGRERDARLLELTRTFCPDALVEALLALDAALSPRAVLACYGFMTRGFPLLRGPALRIVDTIDVFSTKADKVLAFGIADSLALSPAQEAALLAPADLVLAIQPEEAAALRQILPTTPVATVGIDMPAIEPGPAAGPPVVLLVASGNAMNAKGLRDFLRFAWPRVVAALPAAELHVAGAVGLAAPEETSGLRRLGTVDDLAAAYAAARVVINPAVAGTGLKIKTLEALAHGRPIVVWPSGIDGMAPELRDLCVCATDWFAFAEAVTSLLLDDGAARRIADASVRIAALLSPASAYAELDLALGEPTKAVPPSP